MSKVNRHNAAAIVMIIIALIFFCWCSWYETHYTRDASVTAVEGSIITAVDNNGNEWAFEGTGFFVGNRVKLTMNTMHTDSNIYDDEIVNVIIINN